MISFSISSEEEEQEEGQEEQEEEYEEDYLDAEAEANLPFMHGWAIYIMHLHAYQDCPDCCTRYRTSGHWYLSKK